MSHSPNKHERLRWNKSAEREWDVRLVVVEEQDELHQGCEVVTQEKASSPQRQAMAFESLNVRLARANPQISWGFELQAKGQELVVAKLEQNSMAEKAGILIGDTVQEILGQRLTNLQSALSKINGASEITMTLRRPIQDSPSLQWAFKTSPSGQLSVEQYGKDGQLQAKSDAQTKGFVESFVAERKAPVPQPKTTHQVEANSNWSQSEGNVTRHYESKRSYARTETESVENGQGQQVNGNVNRNVNMGQHVNGSVNVGQQGQGQVNGNVNLGQGQKVGQGIQVVGQKQQNQQGQGQQNFTSSSVGQQRQNFTSSGQQNFTSSSVGQQNQGQQNQQVPVQQKPRQQNIVQTSKPQQNQQNFTSSNIQQFQGEQEFIPRPGGMDFTSGGPQQKQQQKNIVQTSNFASSGSGPQQKQQQNIVPSQGQQNQQQPQQNIVQSSGQQNFSSSGSVPQQQKGYQGQQIQNVSSSSGGNQYSKTTKTTHSYETYVLEEPGQQNQGQYVSSGQEQNQQFVSSGGQRQNQQNQQFQGQQEFIPRPGGMDFTSGGPQQNFTSSVKQAPQVPPKRSASQGNERQQQYPQFPQNQYNYQLQQLQGQQLQGQQIQGQGQKSVALPGGVDYTSGSQQKVQQQSQQNQNQQNGYSSGQQQNQQIGQGSQQKTNQTYQINQYDQTDTISFPASPQKQTQEFGQSQGQQISQQSRVQSQGQQNVGQGQTVNYQPNLGQNQGTQQNTGYSHERQFSTNQQQQQFHQGQNQQFSGQQNQTYPSQNVSYQQNQPYPSQNQQNISYQNQQFYPSQNQGQERQSRFQQSQNQGQFNQQSQWDSQNSQNSQTLDRSWSGYRELPKRSRSQPRCCYRSDVLPGPQVFYCPPHSRTYRELSPSASARHLQYNTPIELYSDEAAAEAYRQHTGQELHLKYYNNAAIPIQQQSIQQQPIQQQPIQSTTLQSETRRLIEEQEQMKRLYSPFNHQKQAPPIQSASLKRIAQAVGVSLD